MLLRGRTADYPKAANRIHKNIMHYIVKFRIVRHVVSLFAYISRGSMQGTTHLPWEAQGTGMVICFGGQWVDAQLCREQQHG
jgi:hypothetical protein